MGSTGYLVYGLPYLLMQPEFKCFGLEKGSKEWYEKCTVEAYCGAEGGEIDIDYDSERTLNNWMMRYDLICESSYLINGFGMSFFFGYVIGSFLLPTLSDKTGRRSNFLAI